MANFDPVNVVANADGKTFDLQGQATTEVAEEVTASFVVKAVADGSTKTYDLQDTVQSEQSGETVIESGSDTLGRPYTISADGQHASL